MLHYLLRPANLFTGSSLFCGFYSIVLAAGASHGDSGTFHAAAALILFAGLFDMLDGPVARLTRTTSDFGRQLDSFADLVSFGIAPGVLVYKWGLAGIPNVGFALAFAFVMAGALRLARFNLGVDDDDPAFSRGITITVSGATVAALVIYHHCTGMALLESRLNIALFTLFLTYLMVSDIRFRTLKSIPLRGPTLALGGLAAFSLLVATLALDLSFVLVGIAILYIGSGLLEEAFARGRRRLRRGPGRADLEEEVDPFAALEELDEDEPLGAGVAPRTPRRLRLRWPFWRR